MLTCSVALGRACRQGAGERSRTNHESKTASPLYGMALRPHTTLLDICWSDPMTDRPGTVDAPTPGTSLSSATVRNALRREELCKLKVSDSRHARRGVPHLKVDGKGEKTRFLPLHPGTNAL